MQKSTGQTDKEDPADLGLQAKKLNATIEELQIMNEELRFAGKKLQSINEKLSKVNQDLNVKIDEANIFSNDLQQLISSTEIGTILLDRSFRVVLYTPAARNIFNLSPADFGRMLSDISSSLEYTNVLQDSEMVLSGFNVVEKEVYTKEKKLFLMRIIPYRTDEDRIKGVVISFVNITAGRKNEKAMDGVNERMRLVVESTKDYAIFSLDMDRKINTWNKGAEWMFGYTENDIFGSIVDILYIEDEQNANAPQKEIEKAQLLGRAESESWYRRKDGSSFYGSGTLNVLRDDTGMQIGFVKIMRDLTEQKQAAESLHASIEKYRTELELQVLNRTEELQRSNIDLLQFAHVTSHDLKEPVRKIKTFTGMLLNQFGGEMPEKSHEYLNKIRHAIDRLSSMIEAILNYSRIGSTEETNEIVDLNNVLTEIEYDLEIPMTLKSATIEKPTFPLLTGSRILLHQLFFNLLSNSMKFAKQDVPLRVTLSYQFIEKDGKEFMEINFKDNGIGFEDQYNERIFEAFARLNSKDKYEGTGLGLALAKKIVGRHNGSIHAHGEENNGSTFTILLPR